MRKGIILEINDLYLTMLTPEGEFLRARKLQHDYQVGEEIHFFPESTQADKKKFNLSFLASYKAKSIALVAVLLMAITTFMPVYQTNKVYAYMSIDVNPSIELAVNEQMEVLAIKGYNQEGNEIVSDLDGWKKADAAKVAELILDKIQEKGYFETKNNIVIATVHNGKAKKTIDDQLEKEILEIKKNTMEEKLTLKVMQASSEDREKAQEQGLTTGLYKEKQHEKKKPATSPAKGKELERKQPVQEKEEVELQRGHADKSIPKSGVPQPKQPEPPAGIKEKGNDNGKKPQVPPLKTKEKPKPNNSMGKNIDKKVDEKPVKEKIEVNHNDRGNVQKSNNGNQNSNKNQDKSKK